MTIRYRTTLERTTIGHESILHSFGAEVISVTILGESVKAG